MFYKIISGNHNNNKREINVKIRETAKGYFNFLKTTATDTKISKELKKTVKIIRTVFGPSPKMNDLE